MVVCVCTPTCTCSYHSTLSCTLARCVLSSYFLCVSGFFPFILIVLTAYTHQHMHIAPHVYIPHLTAPLHTLFLPQHPHHTCTHHTSPHTHTTPHHTPCYTCTHHTTHPRADRAATDWRAWTCPIAPRYADVYACGLVTDTTHYAQLPVSPNAVVWLARPSHRMFP